MEYITTSRKRCREESIESDEDHPQPLTKRIRIHEACVCIPEELLLLLDEPVESPATVDQDLESVIRSFEEEIYSASSSIITDSMEAGPIEFLLEASDDDLGIPPPATCADGVVDVIGLGDVDQQLGLGFGLGFEEEWKMSYDLLFGLDMVDDAGEGIIVNYDDRDGFTRCDVDHNFLMFGNYGGSKNGPVSSSWPESLPAL